MLSFLLDMGISPKVAAWLREQGHLVEHIRDIDPRALDEELVALATKSQAIILTSDRDFGALLAKAKLTNPSVILFRLTPAPASAVIEKLAPVLSSHTELLEKGCFITIALGKPRVRKLPLTN